MFWISPLIVVLPRTPQVHVGQQARCPALEVVRRDRAGRPRGRRSRCGDRSGNWTHLVFSGSATSPDCVVFDFAVGRQAGGRQRPVAVDPHAGKRGRRRPHRRDRRRDRHRVHARAEPAADELLVGIPGLVAVEVDPAVDVGLRHAAGRQRNLEGHVVRLAQHQRRDRHAVFVVRERPEAQIIAQRLRVRLAVRLRVGLVGGIAQPRPARWRAGRRCWSPTSDSPPRRRRLPARRPSPADAGTSRKVRANARSIEFSSGGVVRMARRIPQLLPGPRQLAACSPTPRRP